MQRKALNDVVDKEQNKKGKSTTYNGRSKVEDNERKATTNTISLYSLGKQGKQVEIYLLYPQLQP